MSHVNLKDVFGRINGLYLVPGIRLARLPRICHEAQCSQQLV